MKIYVAASWHNRFPAWECITRLKDAGYDVLDWTESDWDKASVMEQYSREEIEHVKDCDLFVIIDPAQCSHRKMIELGVAIALDKPILTVKSRWYGIHTYLKRSIAHAKTIIDAVDFIFRKFPLKIEREYDIDNVGEIRDDEVEVCQYLFPEKQRRKTAAPLGKEYHEKAKNLIIDANVSGNQVVILIRHEKQPPEKVVARTFENQQDLIDGFRNFIDDFLILMEIDEMERFVNEK